MIRVEPGTAELAPVEQYGLKVLIDQSRLLLLEGSDARVTTLHIGPPSPVPLPDVAEATREPVAARGEVRLPRSQLAALGRLAGAEAEQCSTARDRHGRVPASASPVGQDDRWLTPVVSGVARQLGNLVRQVAPDRRLVRLVAPWPDGRRWAVALSHDLDLVAGWPFATALRLAELLRHRAFAGAGAVMRDAARATLGDPVWDAASALLGRLERHGIRSTWFILCGTPTLVTWRQGDLTYRPESPATRRLLAAVVEGGHEIGLHGSFDTERDAAAFSAQRARLEGLVQRPVRGVRQHFLRMRPGLTQRAMRQADFAYDATYGFADRSGFRLASADAVPGWDAQAGAESGLEEMPLVWMDRTLSKYAGVESPDAWVEDGLARAATCRSHEGLWVGLWHPNLSASLGFPGAEHACERLLGTLAEQRPWFGTLDQVREWRQRRRALRAIALREDGTPVVAAMDPPGIEDADGAPAPVERTAA